MLNLTLVILLFMIINSSYAIIAPYQVSIRSNSAAIVGYSNSGQILEQHFCSGVLIKEKYVLTTASCLSIVDKQSKVSRYVYANEISVVAGSVRPTGSSTGNWTNSIDSVRRNVLSVIPHPGFNESSGANDIGLLLLDRSLLLHNTTSVMLIELAQLPQNPPTSTNNSSQLHPQHQQQQQQNNSPPTSVPTSNKVNENCFINVYNNSVGFSNYPYTTVTNVSFLDKWICDQSWTNPGGRAEGRCLEYRFSGPQSCLLDSRILRTSDERGTALVCNYTLAGILAEINPAPNPTNCVALKRTTAYYTPIEPFREWIASEIGPLYSTRVVSGTGASASHPNPAGTAPFPPTGASWTNQQINEGKPKSSGSILIVSMRNIIKLALIQIVWMIFNKFQ